MEQAEQVTTTIISWWTSSADLCTSNSRAVFSLVLVVTSQAPSHGRNHSSSHLTQYDLHAGSAPLVASLLHLSTGDSPPLTPCIGFALAQSACSAPLAVTMDATLAAACTLLGALGSDGSADMMSRRLCRAHGWQRARRSY